jgi:hypothetical protein
MAPVSLDWENRSGPKRTIKQNEAKVRMTDLRMGPPWADKMALNRALPDDERLDWHIHQGNYKEQ